MATEMLERWASALEERKAIDDFLDWLVQFGHQGPRFIYGREEALDRFFEIDRRQLEKERRALLAAATSPEETAP